MTTSEKRPPSLGPNINGEPTLLVHCLYQKSPLNHKRTRSSLASPIFCVANKLGNKKIEDSLLVYHKAFSDHTMATYFGFPWSSLLNVARSYTYTSWGRFFVMLSTSLFPARHEIFSCFPTDIKIYICGFPIHLVPSWEQARTQLDTRFSVVSPYTSCLAGNELVHNMTKNTISVFHKHHNFQTIHIFAYSNLTEPL